MIPPKSEIKDRRNWERFKVNDSVKIHLVREGMVLDESPAGLGLSLSEAYDLKIGDQVLIQDTDDLIPVTARVVNIQQSADGAWRPGPLGFLSFFCLGVVGFMFLGFLFKMGRFCRHKGWRHKGWHHKGWRHHHDGDDGPMPPWYDPKEPVVKA